jgi:amidase
LLELRLSLLSRESNARLDKSSVNPLDNASGRTDYPRAPHGHYLVPGLPKGGLMKQTPVLIRTLCVIGALGLFAARPVAIPAAQGVGGQFDTPRSFELVEATIPELQAALTTHFVNSKQLVKLYLDRFAAYGATLNPFITVNPAAIADAHRLDIERAQGLVRGPLHGIPIVLKDNILTADIPTSGGALAFKGFMPPYQATLATKLKNAGAIILAKTVLTELANWVSDAMPGNYSAVGGYGYNPYDPRQDPRPGTDARGFPFADGRPALATGGSSSGIATAANLAAANVGTETSGSILSPSNQNMLVGIKPTVGLISRHGVIPITADQDTAGPMARDVTSAAIMLNVMAGPDPLDTPAFMGPPQCATVDYTKSLDPHGLQGAHIGIAKEYYDTSNAATKAAIDAAAADLTAAGATVAMATVPSFNALNAWGICAAREQTKANDANCSVVLKYGFKRDFNAFLTSLHAVAPVATLSDLRAFNLAHAGAIKYLQARLDISDEMNVATDFARYQADRVKDLALAGASGIDAALALGSYDALLFAGARGADIAARPGYPSVTVPYSFIPNAPTPPFPDGFDAKPAPLGMTFTARACSEPTLIRLAYAFEQATHRRVPPFSAPPLRKDSKGNTK